MSRGSNYNMVRATYYWGERREMMERNIVITMILMGALVFLMLAVGNEVALVNVNYGNLVGSISNIFGDSVADAKVSINGKFDLTDEVGEFQILRIPNGRYNLKVQADGYKEYNREVIINGDTNLRLRYDLGLWPSELGIDFHVYYNYGYDGNMKAFAEVGIANGGEKNYYITSCTIFDPYKQIVKELLDREDTYRNFSGGLSENKYTRDPRLAVVVEPKTSHVIKSIPIKDVPVKEGTYTLKVTYGDMREHTKGTYRSITLIDVMDLDEDWNPHTP